MLHHNTTSFSHYITIIKKDYSEKVKMLNLLTTNETYFFRESKHFDFLSSLVSQAKINQKFRVWSAASSVGAEAYSIAMTLDHGLNLDQWQVLGSDINCDVIKKAKRALYCESWVDKIPQHHKSKYCLRGGGKHTGQFTIDSRLKNNVDFEVNNLTVANSSFGHFDVIFLRNVLIYFNIKTRQHVLNNVLKNLKVGGYFIISLTENLDGLDTRNLIKHQSSIFKKVA